MAAYKGYEIETDEGLIKRFHEGEEEIMDYLLDKYKNLVRKKARAMYLIGGDNDDLIQEGMIGLYKAISKYDPSKEASFFNFADLCIARQIYTAVTASNRKKHTPLNSYISLNSNGVGVDSEDFSMLKVLNTLTIKNPEDLVIDKENLGMIEYEIERSLSNFEKQVLKLYVSGIGYVEISEELGKNPKSIDNALQRIRNKLSTILNQKKHE